MQPNLLDPKVCPCTCGKEMMKQHKSSLQGHEDHAVHPTLASQNNAAQKNSKTNLDNFSFNGARLEPQSHVPPSAVDLAKEETIQSVQVLAGHCLRSHLRKLAFNLQLILCLEVNMEDATSFGSSIYIYIYIQSYHANASAKPQEKLLASGSDHQLIDFIWKSV